MVDPGEHQPVLAQRQAGQPDNCAFEAGQRRAAVCRVDRHPGQDLRSRSIAACPGGAAGPADRGWPWRDPGLGQQISPPQRQRARLEEIRKIANLQCQSVTGVGKCSCPLRPCEGKGPAAFPLVRALWVGATGFEPVTPSVSESGGNRCARSRSPRSPSTVEAVGKRSLDVQGNALFRPFDAAVAPRTPRVAPRFRVHLSLYEAAHLHPCIALDGRVPADGGKRRAWLWVGMVVRWQPSSQ
jgi:hypothetical protein